MVEQALILAHHGFKVFPLGPGAKTPHGKLVPHGCLQASSEPATIRTWWAVEPAANIGIATGHGGLLVVDIDPDKGGYESARRLADHLPLTLGVRTGTGGMHLYYLARDPKNSAGKLGNGIDTRGAGGYVVAPPSIHPNGNAYVWLARPSRPRRPIAAPASLERLLSPASSPARIPSLAPPQLPPAGQGASTYAIAAVAGMIDDIHRAPEGTRNDTLHQAGRRIGRLQAGGHMEQHHADETLGRLVLAAEVTGLTHEEAIATVMSGYRYGLTVPIDVPVRDPMTPPTMPIPRV